MFTQKEIIDLAILIEENGEDIYRNAAKTVLNPTIATMLGTLADEEAEHARWFAEQLNGLKSHIDNSDLERLGRAMLRDAVGGKAFALKDTDFSEMDDIRKLAETSIEFEKDTILFYEMLQAFIDDDKSLEKLNLIIAEENRHVEKLEALVISDR